MQQVFLIALGGSLGAVARYSLSTIVYHTTNEFFPWGTLVVNLTGCFLIGVFTQLFETAIIPSEWRSSITIGFIGAYTTFSTYSFETLNLLREGEFGRASLNIIASNLLGLLLVVAGIYSARAITRLFS